MNFAAPKNKNYCAVVVALERFAPLANCDNLKAALIFGNSVIVSKDVEAGAVGVFFPTETALSAAFLGPNNLFNKPELGNVDPTRKGYFEAHGRVRTVKFRGHKSEGFWIPLECLSFLGLPLSEYLVGSEFDAINETPICSKYISKRNQASTRQGKPGQSKKKSVADDIIEGQFRFHIDTAHLGRNIHRIDPATVISISEKWHGTSAIFANILIKRKLNWLERTLQRLGFSIQDHEYGFTWASRRVLKGVNQQAKADAVHFYSDDIWGIVGKEVAPLIPKGFTVYGEIVGYMPDGGMIQKGYHYGCQTGSHRFLVYRVTFVNEDGRVVELGWNQVQEFCTKQGMECVKQIFYGQAGQLLSVTSFQNVEQWREALLDLIHKDHVPDAMCAHNKMQVPLEGVVVRVERFDECESYKLKSFLFRKMESDSADNGEVDTETLQDVAA